MLSAQLLALEVIANFCYTKSGSTFKNVCIMYSSNMYELFVGVCVCVCVCGCGWVWVGVGVGAFKRE